MRVSRPVTDLFEFIPPAYFSPSVPKLTKKLFLTHGGDIYHPDTKSSQAYSQIPAHLKEIFTYGRNPDPIEFPATIFFVSSPDDPLIPHLYQRYIHLFSAEWVLESFKADRVLPLNGYKINAWEYTGDLKFINPALLSFTPLTPLKVPFTQPIFQTDQQYSSQTTRIREVSIPCLQASSSIKEAVSDTPHSGKTVTQPAQNAISNDFKEVKQEPVDAPLQADERLPYKLKSRKRPSPAKDTHRQEKITKRAQMSSTPYMLSQPPGLLNLLIDPTTASTDINTGAPSSQELNKHSENLSNKDDHLKTSTSPRSAKDDSPAVVSSGDEYVPDEDIEQISLRPYIHRPSESQYKHPPTIDERVIKSLGSRYRINPR